MNIALCVAFLEEDLWGRRLLAAAYPKRLGLTQYYGTGPPSLELTKTIPMRAFQGGKK